jgi:nitrite reductase (NADH) small subunit
MKNWNRVGALTDIPRQGSRIVATASGNIALFRAQDDSVYAVRDRCPHKGGPLSQGIVQGHRVACPLHNWVIDLQTGEAVAPDQGRTACHAVKVEDGNVWLKG